MKLTRRVLAVVIAVAMLAGVLSIGVNAATATSLTTYGTYDAETNPYQAKLGLKVYRVDTDTEEYTEITDGKVSAGDVIRVELWGQTNYHTIFANYVMAYSNSFFTPTMLDYSTYDYSGTAPSGLGASVVEQVAFDEDAAAAAAEVDLENNYATYDTPYPYNATSDMLTAFAGGNNANTIAEAYPSAWKGTASGYNIVMAGLGPVNPDNFDNFPATAEAYVTRAAVISYYQPLVYFNLTVPANAQDGTSGTISIPEVALKSSSNTSGRLYVSAAIPNPDYFSGNDLAEAQTLNAAEFNNVQFKDTYEDGTTMDRVVDLSDATVTLTVGEGGTVAPVVDKAALDAAIKTLPEIAEADAEETSWAAYEAALAKAKKVYADAAATQDAVNAAKDELLEAIAAVTEKPAVAPELVALGDTIIDEERGFIYGLPCDGTLSDTLEGYVDVTGDGSFQTSYADGAEGFGTGAKVELLDADGEVVETYYIVIFGDNDGNGYIDDIDMNDAADAFMFNECKYDYGDLTIPNVFAMDIYADGMVDDTDIAFIEDLCMFNIDTIAQDYQPV